MKCSDNTISVKAQLSSEKSIAFGIGLVKNGGDGSVSDYESCSRGGGGGVVPKWPVAGPLAGTEFGYTRRRARRDATRKTLGFCREVSCCGTGAQNAQGERESGGLSGEMPRSRYGPGPPEGSPTRAALESSRRSRRPATRRLRVRTWGLTLASEILRWLTTLAWSCTGEGMGLMPRKPQPSPTSACLMAVSVGLYARPMRCRPRFQWPGNAEGDRVDQGGPAPLLVPRAV